MYLVLKELNMYPVTNNNKKKKKRNKTEFNLHNKMIVQF